MNAKKTTFTELVVKGLLLFSVFTVLQGLPAFDSINRIWLVVVSLALVSRLVTYRYSVTEFLVLTITVILHVIAVYYTDFPMYHTNMLFYFMLWVVLYVFFAKSKDKILEVLKSSKTYITWILWIWTVLVGISAFIPSCYEGRYFFSFTGTSFRLMPSVLIITALTFFLVIQRNDKRYYLFIILPCYAAFMNQSRTYFGIYVLFLLMYMYMRIKSKRNFLLMLLPFSVLLFIVTLNSGIIDKFAKVWVNGVTIEKFLASFTNARSIFWKWDLDAFFSLPLWQQFVGNGFDFAYEVTDAYGRAFWAHNDVINLLMNFGYIGVIIYYWAYMKMVNVFFPKKNTKISNVVKMLFHAAVFINSMMNMSYTYFCAVIAYPLFLCVVSVRYGKDGNYVGCGTNIHGGAIIG